MADCKACGAWFGTVTPQDLCPTCERALNRLNGYATPVVHGRWEWFDEDTGTPITGYEREWGWRCSHCGGELSDDYDDPDYRPKLNYCPNCGAKMDE